MVELDYSKTVHELAQQLRESVAQDDLEWLMASLTLTVRDMLEQLPEPVFNQPGGDVWLAVSCLQREEAAVAYRGSILIWLEAKGYGEFTPAELIDRKKQEFETFAARARAEVRQREKQASKNRPRRARR